MGTEVNCVVWFGFPISGFISGFIRGFTRCPHTLTIQWLNIFQRALAQVIGCTKVGFDVIGNYWLPPRGGFGEKVQSFLWESLACYAYF